jgi:hypothetical protein
LKKIANYIKLIYNLSVAFFCPHDILFSGSFDKKEDTMRLDILAPIVVCLLSVAAAYLFIPSNKLKNAYIITAMVAVVIRLAMVAYLYSGGTDTFGTDGLLYHKEGIKIAHQLASGVPIYSLKYSYTWYTVFVGLIYHLFGINRYIVSYINIEFAFLAALLLFKMATNHQYRFSNAAFISLAFLYFPNLFLWTTDSRKEALLIFINNYLFHISILLLIFSSFCLR